MARWKIAKTFTSTTTRDRECVCMPNGTNTGAQKPNLAPSKVNRLFSRSHYLRHEVGCALLGGQLLFKRSDRIFLLLCPSSLLSLSSVWCGAFVLIYRFLSSSLDCVRYRGACCRENQTALPNSPRQYAGGRVGLLLKSQSSAV